MMNMTNMMNGMFGKVSANMCKISMTGEIAIKTSNGYKTYNVDTGVCTNVSDFAFNADEFFFIIPTNKVERGDIILASGKPRCVLEVKKNAIETFCYEDGTISTIVPEHHPFLGKTYFYGKIVSMFGNIKTDKGMNKMMKFMMMSQMFGGSTNKYGNSTGDMGQMLPMMMLMSGNGFDGMFEDMFDFETEENTETENK